MFNNRYESGQQIEACDLGISCQMDTVVTGLLPTSSFFLFFPKRKTTSKYKDQRSKVDFSSPCRNAFQGLLAQPFSINTNKSLRNIWVTFCRNPLRAGILLSSHVDFLDALEKTQGSSVHLVPLGPSLFKLGKLMGNGGQTVFG